MILRFFMLHFIVRGPLSWIDLICSTVTTYDINHSDMNFNITATGKLGVKGAATRFQKHYFPWLRIQTILLERF